MNEILEDLKNKYNKYILSRKDILEILNISSSTFNNIIVTNHLYKLPKFSTLSYSNAHKNYELYQFNLYDVAEFLAEKEAINGKKSA